MDSPLPDSPVRFVVLAHDVPGVGRHFDLMIQDGQALATWKCPCAPEFAEAAPLVAQRLADHRVHYLTYEGPISGNRGSVRRHDEGTCTCVARSRSRWTVEFAGKHLVGRFDLVLVDAADQSWSLSARPKCGPSG